MENFTGIVQQSPTKYSIENLLSSPLVVERGTVGVRYDHQTRSNHQTRYHMPWKIDQPISIICVICQLAVHDIGIHAAQYMFTMLLVCKLHPVPNDVTYISDRCGTWFGPFKCLCHQFIADLIKYFVGD